MFFFSSSTKRYAHLHCKLTEIENSLHLRNLSKTRWTARAESLKAVWISYEIILEALLVMSSAQKLDKSTRTQAFGLSKKMLSFDFVIALYFMKNIMYKMKILTEKLKAIELNVIDALMLLNNTIEILKDINNDDAGMENLVESSINLLVN